MQIKSECRNAYHFLTPASAGADDTVDESVTFQNK